MPEQIELRASRGPVRRLDRVDGLVGLRPAGRGMKLEGEEELFQGFRLASRGRSETGAEGGREGAVHATTRPRAKSTSPFWS